jgi:hypothetical protein
MLASSASGVLVFMFSTIIAMCSPGRKQSVSTVPRAVFSDLDGTLLHYAKRLTFQGKCANITIADQVGRLGIVKNEDGEARLCRLFQSSALGNGFMSYR